MFFLLDENQKKRASKTNNQQLGSFLWWHHLDYFVPDTMQSHAYSGYTASSSQALTILMIRHREMPAVNAYRLSEKRACL